MRQTGRGGKARQAFCCAPGYTDVVRELIAQALLGSPVVAAYLFGSRPRGLARPDSDTDIACLLPRGMSADLHLVGDLSVRLERAGIVSPDVHILNEAPLAFQIEALRGERVFSTDETVRGEYEAWLTLRYLDFEPLLTLQYRIQRRRLAQKGTLGRPGARRPQVDSA